MKKKFKHFPSAPLKTGNHSFPQMTGSNIFLVNQIPSTNNTLKRPAFNRQLPDGAVLIARRQTAGKGRLGRRFHSPADCGLYLSMLFRPEPDSPLPQMLTMATSVILCRAIEAVCDMHPKIKWVNDLIDHGKKICGILAESVPDPDSPDKRLIVLGIGLNVYAPAEGYPKELQAIAGALYPPKTPGMSDRRLLLATEIIRGLRELSIKPNASYYIEEYRKHSCLIGRQVTLIKGKDHRSGQVLGFNNKGHLIFLPDDRTETVCISSGEVSVRNIKTRKNDLQ